MHEIHFLKITYFSFSGFVIIVTCSLWFHFNFSIVNSIIRHSYLVFPVLYWHFLFIFLQLKNGWFIPFFKFLCWHMFHHTFFLHTNIFNFPRFIYLNWIFFYVAVSFYYEWLNWVVPPVGLLLIKINFCVGITFQILIICMKIQIFFVKKKKKIVKEIDGKKGMFTTKLIFGKD